MCSQVLRQQRRTSSPRLPAERHHCIGIKMHHLSLCRRVLCLKLRNNGFLQGPASAARGNPLQRQSAQSWQASTPQQTLLSARTPKPAPKAPAVVKTILYNNLLVNKISPFVWSLVTTFRSLHSSCFSCTTTVLVIIAGVLALCRSFCPHNRYESEPHQECSTEPHPYCITGELSSLGHHLVFGGLA